MSLRVRRVIAAVLASVAPLVGWPSATAQTAPVVTSSPPPVGVVGNGYLHAFAVSPPGIDTTFSITSGSLPPGLVLSVVGLVTGTPFAAGTFGPTTVCGHSLLGPPACQTFTMTIARRVPAILASPSAGGPVGFPVRETATLVGAFLPTGLVTFRLFSDPACSVEVFSSTKTLSILGAATSDDVAPAVPGTYRWTTTYSGDANNQPVSTPCDPSNSVTVAGTSPSTTTTSTTTTVPPTTTSTSTTSTTTTSASTSTTSTSTTTTAPTTTTTAPTTTTTSPTTTTTEPTAPAATTTTTTAPTTTTTAPTTTTTAPTTTSTTSTTTSTTVAPPPAGTTTTSSTTSTTSTTAPDAPPTLQLSPEEAAPGEAVTVSGRGYPAGAPLLVELFTDPVLLTSTTADAEGGFQIVVTVPPGAPPGTAVIRVSTQGGTHRAESSLRVTDRSAPPGLLDGVTRSILDILGLGLSG